MKTLPLKKYFSPFTTFKALYFIVLIGLAVFLNGIFNNFLGDDLSQITENPVVHSVQNLPIFFSGSTYYNGDETHLEGIYYRPLMTTYFSLLYSLFGQNAFAFHLFQILLFICNACLTFLVLKHFFKRSIAFILALIFLVHPINSEAAFYISNIQELLFFFFGITALWIIQQHQSTKTYILVSFLLLCSLLSKETGILFLIMILLYQIIFIKKHSFRLFGYLLIACLIFLTLRIHALGVFPREIIVIPIYELDFLHRMINIPALFSFYITTFLLPINLSLSYHWIYTKITLNSFFIPLLLDLVFLAIIFCFGLMIAKKKLHKYFKYYLFFTCWFLLGLLLHLQLFPLDATVADRWFYFPSVGILGFIGVIMESFQIRIERKLILIPIIVIVILLSIRTYIRSFNWTNEMTLFSHDAQVSKNDFILESLLSQAYYHRGQYNEAKSHASKSIAIFPNTINYHNLGVAESALGNQKQAKEIYLKGLTVQGDYYLIYNDLAILSLVYGDTHENIDFIKNISLVKYPSNWRLWVCLAWLEYQNGDKDQAKVAINQAKKYDSNQIITYVYTQITNNKPLDPKIKFKSND